MARPIKALTFQSIGSALTVKVQAHTLLAILVCFCATHTARAQPPNCPPTLGELQHKVDNLEHQKDTVNSFLKKEAFHIFDSSYKGLNSAIDAGPGALFLKSDEFEKIQKTILEAETAAKDADLAWQRAENALRSGQRDVAIAKMLEATLAGAEAKSKFRESFKQTADVFERATGVLTGDIKPQELAERFWESRHDVANALNELSLTGQAMENHKSLILLMGDLNRQIDELRSQQRSAPYSRSPSQQAACRPRADKQSKDCTAANEHCCGSPGVDCSCRCEEVVQPIRGLFGYGTKMMVPCPCK